jgi:hypothetical protein
MSEELTIEQCEAEISRIEGLVQDLRKEQKGVHDIMERKIRLKPIVATPSDQIIDMNQDIVSQLKALPPALFERAKAFFSTEDK